MSRDKKSTNGEIWLSGDFTFENVLEVRKQIMDVANKEDGMPIIVHINSYGGSVDALNCLLDTFTSIKNKVITVCCGTAMSAGAALLSAGDLRFITSSSRVMIHKVSSGTSGKVDDMKNDVDETIRLNKQFIELIAKNSKKSAKQLNDLLKDNTDLFLSPAAALKFGIVDQVGLPRLNAQIVYSLEIFNKKEKK